MTTLSSVEKLTSIIRDYLMLEEHEERPTLPIFIEGWPSDIDECIMISNEGQSSRATYLGQTDEVSAPLITCMVRTDTYDKGITNASIIRNLLNQKVIIGNISIVPNTNVRPLGRDERRRHIFRIVHKTIVKE